MIGPTYVPTIIVLFISKCGPTLGISIITQGKRAGRTVSLTGKQKLTFVLNLSEGFCGFCGKSKILLVVSVVLLNAARAETSANNGDCPSCYYSLWLNIKQRVGLFYLFLHPMKNFLSKHIDKNDSYIRILEITL